MDGCLIVKCLDYQIDTYRDWETKGGSVNFAPKEIIILSNKAPEDWYDKTKCAWEPLERRIENYGQMMPGGEIMWLKQKEE